MLNIEHCYLDIVTSADIEVLRDWLLWNIFPQEIQLMFFKQIASGIEATKIIAGV